MLGYSKRGIRQLLLDFRHRMLDLFFVVHTPSDVPPRVWGFTSTVFVGATDSLVNKSQIKTDSADQIIKAQREINELYRQAKAKGDNSHDNSTGRMGRTDRLVQQRNGQARPPIL